MKALLLGGTGFIGTSIVSRRPQWSWTVHGRHMADLFDSASIDSIQDNFDVVINASGFYGGIVFNQKYGQQIVTNNLYMTATIWDLLQKINPAKFINIGSACIYPRTCTDQIRENQIGQRNYHPSVKHSATAKHLQLDLLQNSDVKWEYLILSNVYGPREHVDFDKSHFVGGLISKLKQNKNHVKMLGTGAAVRDFIYIDDATEAICKYAELDQATCMPTNIGTGVGTSIKCVTQKLATIVNPDLQIEWGDTKDDGVLYKVLNNEKMLQDIGWNPPTDLDQGLDQTWEYFKNV